MLLNDPTYVEASRALAERIQREGGATTADRVRWAWKQVLSRSPLPREAELLTTLFEQHLKQYQADPKAAEELLKVGMHNSSPVDDAPELAAWTSVARILLNLHETITRS